MGWFRRHIKTGSRLALIALALQFALAFGHVHPSHAQTVSAGVIADAVVAEYGAALPAPADDDQHYPRTLNDTCAVCAVVAMAAHALFSTSPLLHLPQAFSLIHRATDAGFAHLDPAHGPFQPRGPPTS